MQAIFELFKTNSREKKWWPIFQEIEANAPNGEVTVKKFKELLWEYSTVHTDFEEESVVHGTLDLVFPINIHTLLILVRNREKIMEFISVHNAVERAWVSCGRSYFESA